jgi:hypothetical protein
MVLLPELPFERAVGVVLDGLVDLAVVGYARAYGDSGEEPLEHHSPGAVGLLQELGKGHQVLEVILVDPNAFPPGEDAIVIIVLGGRPLDRAEDARKSVLLLPEHPKEISAEKPLDPLVIEEMFAGMASSEPNCGPMAHSIRLATTVEDVVVESYLKNAERVWKVDPDKEPGDGCLGGVGVLDVHNMDPVRDVAAEGFVDTRIEQEVERRLTDYSPDTLGSDTGRSGLVALLILCAETLVDIAMPNILGVGIEGGTLEVEVRNSNLRVAGLIDIDGGRRKVSPDRLVSTGPKNVSPNSHVDDGDNMKNNNRLLEKVREQGRMKMDVTVEEAELSPLELDVLEYVFLSKSVHALFGIVGMILTALPSSPSIGTSIRLWPPKASVAVGPAGMTVM